MKANELRLGNFIWHETWGNHVVMTVKNIDEYRAYLEVDTGYLADFDLSKAHGIPLTEEWLIKFGFNRRDSSTCTQWFIGMNDFTHDWLFDLTWLENPVLINAPDAPFYRNGRHTIFYVHQLQNLYFALTGEELTIKSDDIKRPA